MHPSLSLPLFMLQSSPAVIPTVSTAALSSSSSRPPAPPTDTPAMSSHKSRKHSRTATTKLCADPRLTRKAVVCRRATFVCSANRCIMSVLPQWMSNRAATNLHATMKTRDLNVCQNCVDRHTDKQCSVPGCKRVDVFGEEAIGELSFSRHTDDKLYCPPCMKRIYNAEDASLTNSRANKVQEAKKEALAEEEDCDERSSDSEDSANSYA